jgi:L1 cell adhesion molecule like protein
MAETTGCCGKQFNGQRNWIVTGLLPQISKETVFFQRMNVIGIDLGTAYSSVGRLIQQGVLLIPDGDRVGVPSVVAYQSGEWQVGKLAVARAPSFPNSTILDTKRMLGCSFDMPAIQYLRSSWPFQTQRSLIGEILICVQETDGMKQYRPYQISAKILAKLKQMAERAIGRSVTEAAITVPAYFSDAQREDTKRAAALAGLTVLRLVNEPSAGAIAYGYETQPQVKKTVIIFDLGGGTLDVSLMTIEHKKYAVQAVSGDSHLGGRDFDQRLMQLCVRSFDTTGRVQLANLNQRNYHKLRARCKEAKCELSDSEQTIVYIEDFHGGQDLDVHVTRTLLEAECRDLFARMLDPVEEVLDFAEKTVREIDEVLLIGGGSVMPNVRQILARYFQKQPFFGVNPLEAVAKGATIIAGTLKSGLNIREIQDIEWFDICALPLGVEMVGSRMCQMIPHGMRLPARGQSQFFTVVHNQTSITFSVFEGPWMMTNRNRQLGSFTVNCIPTKTAHLFSAQRARRTLEERAAQRTLDAREYDESSRKITIENLAMNFRSFLEQEPRKNSEFDQFVPRDKRPALILSWSNSIVGRDHKVCVVILP